MKRKIKHQPILSIIIANYNGKKFLPRLCKSLYEQTFKNFEIILVDNSSTDSSIDYIKSNYNKIKVYKTENKGYGHGCNVGAKKAKGEYLILLNPDMYCPKDFLNNILKYYLKIQKNNPKSKLGAIGLQIIDFDSKLKDTQIVTHKMIDIFGNIIDFKIPNPSNKTLNVPGCPFLIKKSVYLKTKGFNTNIFLYGEEIEYCWRLTILGYDNYLDTKNELFHYGSGIVGKTNGKKIAHMIYGNIISCYTNYSLPLLIIISPLYIIYYLLLMFSSIIITKLKFEYFTELLKLIPRFIINFKNINKMRIFTQNNRKVSDIQFCKYISLIPAVIARRSNRTIAEAEAGVET